MDPGRLVDRTSELEKLDRAWEKGGLVVIYGRRRIGKTRLVLEWARGRRHAYYQAGLWGHRANMEGLSHAIEEQLGVPGASGVGDLRSLLSLTAGFVRERAALIIDEFTYWARTDPGVVSDIQWFVDHVLPGSKLLLVLTGSIVGVMERSVLGGSAPLYGRATLRLRLGELSPWCIPSFAPGYTPSQLVEAYSLFGGTPYYLRLLDPSKTPLDAWHELLGPRGLLGDEPVFTLRDEFRDPHPYLALLQAMAIAPWSPVGKAAARAGLPSSHASMYARKLVMLGVLREIPLLSPGRRRLYSIVDKPLRALLSYPAHALEDSSPRVRQWYAGIVSQGWEELAMYHATYHLAQALGVNASRAGKVLHKGGEIDWVVIDEENERILAVEAKWTNMSRVDAERLAGRVRNLASSLLPAGYSHYSVTPVLYLRRAGGGRGYYLVTPEDLPWGRCR
ncbi:MAG: ATP-binding protein [Desulfurococcales archaeon]|nr:ATP-binding protein [Desulfurococcales archaeon]